MKLGKGTRTAPSSLLHLSRGVQQVVPQATYTLMCAGTRSPLGAICKAGAELFFTVRTTCNHRFPRTCPCPFIWDQRPNCGQIKEVGQRVLTVLGMNGALAQKALQWQLFLPSLNLRVTYVRVGDRQLVLVFTKHHISIAPCPALIVAFASAVPSLRLLAPQICCKPFSVHPSSSNPITSELMMNTETAWQEDWLCSENVSPEDVSEAGESLVNTGLSKVLSMVFLPAPASPVTYLATRIQALHSNRQENCIFTMQSSFLLFPSQASMTMAGKFH